MIRRFFISLWFVLLSMPVMATEVALNPDHPQQHVVVRGDTLWDISGMFLQFPWHWPDIWHANPQIENPHLIYPGDVISLVYRDGRPVLELTRGSTAYKMSPEVREITLERAIPTIPLDAIRPFLSRPRVVAEEVLATAPYIVASSDERIISGAGDKVYARGVDEEQGMHHSVFRGGPVYKDPETGEILGYEAIYTADAWISVMGDPATVDLRKTTREVMVGDRLLPVVEDDYEMNFIPRASEDSLNGYIISVLDGVSQVGQYQIVVLNLGERDNLEIGHVLSVYQAGDTVIDPILSGREDEDYFNLHNKGKDRNASVTLPDEFSGVAMVFKVFEKVSYAIIMKAKQAIHISDKVSSNLDVARSIREKRKLRLNHGDNTLAE
ncbi:MAG: LysM peptidoglycan-binding domain-containing protein [Piscirickettsiaceae bacterium]|nr:LysM peptidoglycan-binding domain-containing protein [Piscirickettsiaceae bacterium]